MKVLGCWSGGKNSTHAALLHIEQGNDLTLACYIPYFFEDIPLIDVSHYSYLMNMRDYFSKLGVNVVFLRGISYYDWCHVKFVRGKFAGLERGSPSFFRGKCGFARDGKIKVINDYIRFSSISFDKIDIGLANDEVDRKVLKGREISILRDLKIDDMDSFYYLRSLNLLSPRYEFSNRDGCLLCPQAKKEERYRFFDNYPEAIPLVADIQRLDKRLGYYPLRNYHYFIENDEFVSKNGSNISLFGNVYF